MTFLGSDFYDGNVVGLIFVYWAVFLFLEGFFPAGMMTKHKIDPTDFALAIDDGGSNHSPIEFKRKEKNGAVEVSLEAVESVIGLEGSKNDANMFNSPEGTSFTLAEFLKREFALNRVYSQNVARAHRNGDIHIHKLAFIDRPYCSGQSVEYVKKFGLDRYSSVAAVKPAAHIDSLLDHLWRMTVALRARFGGAIGWDAVNVLLAPYLGGMGDAEIYQYAQKLIYSFNQTTCPHGAQPVFSDLNFYWEVPGYLRNVPALGPRGTFTGKRYKDYQKEAQAFVWQIFNVYKKGDANGAPFFWPKPNVHITDRFWETEGHEEFLDHICEVAAKTGNTYFIFDRGETTKISECCRLRFELSKEEEADTKYPWRMRYAAGNYITPNLPRLVYLSRGKEKDFFRRLREVMELIFEAHRHEKVFLKKLLSLGEKGPLAMLAVVAPGEKEPYLRFDRMPFLIGILGVSDAVKALTGRAMDKDDQALKVGLKMVAFMKMASEQSRSKNGIKFVLEQDPAESTGYRFAKMDLIQFPDQASGIVHGDLKNGSVYYTNSTHLDVDAPFDPVERVFKEGLFHPLIEGGNITHVWLGEHQPSAKSLANLVKKTFFDSQSNQIAFSPEFTVCRKCGKVQRGLKKTCRFCGSRKVDGITRITGYYTFTSSWNKGKLAELKDRYRAKWVEG